ncbi:MAG: hypothetical protein O7F73_15635, partial [Gammaproteobacteria bacterium]|nr:hypothetical protein [Gammaproteobacteria bacterium]
LEYVVNESLIGQGDKIKATTIAIEVFGRGVDFDQQNDPIVRVEAGRLRQRLADYYNESGRHDPVLIDIPKGGYRPRFAARDIVVSGAAGIEGAPAQSRGNLPLAIAAGIIALLLVTVSVLLYKQNNVEMDEDRASTEFTLTAPKGKPFIVVIPVAATSADEESARLATGLVESLITDLSKLSGLSVMAHASVLEARQRDEPYSIIDFRNDFGVTHLLRGTVEREGDRVVLNVQLIDARTATVLWAERMSRSLDKIIDLEEELALAIVNELAVHLQPGERERLSQYHASNSEAWLLYRQGLITIMPPRDLARVQAARQLFQRAMELDPTFAGGYVGQSFSHTARVLFMNTSQPELELKNAITMAQKAIALDENFGGGYAVLAFAQVLGADAEEALRNAEKSVAIQPGDAFSQFILGLNLIIAKRPEEGIAHLQEALRLDPLESRTPYLNVIGIGYYVAGDYSKALRTIEYNYEKGGPRGPHMDVFLAASSAQLGQRIDAQRMAEGMQQKYPGFPFKAWLSTWLRDDGVLQQTLA